MTNKIRRGLITDKEIFLLYCNNQNPIAIWRTIKTTEDLQLPNLTTYDCNY